VSCCFPTRHQLRERATPRWRNLVTIICRLGSNFFLLVGIHMTLLIFEVSHKRSNIFQKLGRWLGFWIQLFERQTSPHESMNI
jgi:hypothetical protein